jgi:hypothetical protein
MVAWAEFAERAPELAEEARRRVEGTGLSLIGTIRRDGWPRISAVEPYFVQGELLLGMMWQSRKAVDLLRDPRCVLHSTISNRDGSEGEVKLYGRGRGVQHPELRARYAKATRERIDWEPEGPFHLFALDIERAAYLRFADDGPTAERWSSSGGT